MCFWSIINSCNEKYWCLYLWYFPVSLPLPYHLPQDLSIAAYWSLCSLQPLFSTLHNSHLAPHFTHEEHETGEAKPGPQNGPHMAEGVFLAHDSWDTALQCGYRTSGKQGVANALRIVVNYGTLSLSDLPSLFSECGRHRASLPVTGTVTGQPGCLWSVIPGFLCPGGV